MEPSTLPRPSDLLIRESTDLAILEATDGGDGVFNADGTVNMVLIRPCAGRGVYNNIYEAPALQRDAEAGVFKGWPMFDNHDNPAARKARMGLPRAVSELAGVVRESHWDPDLTTPDDSKYGYEKGGVIGRCKLTGAMEALVREVPEVIKGSLNCQATNKRLGQRDGARGWIVEGFVNDPENSSFDLVTKAGAGGRVRSVLEALYDGSNATEGLTSALHGITDQQLAEFLREHRPDVLEGGPMNLQEALQSDEVVAMRKREIQEALAEALPVAVEAALPAAIEVRENDIRETIREEIGQSARLRALHADAKGIIEAAILPKTAKEKLLRDYGLTENDDDTVTAGRSLSVVEAVVENGQVTKPARTVLKDELEEEIASYRNMIREAAPTIPRAPGSAAAASAAAPAGEPDIVARLRKKGLDPSRYGFAKPEPAATT